MLSKLKKIILWPYNTIIDHIAFEVEYRIKLKELKRLDDKENN